MASSGVRGRARQEDTGDTGSPRIGDRPARGGQAAAGAADGLILGPLIALISTGLPPPSQGP